MHNSRQILFSLPIYLSTIFARKIRHSNIRQGKIIHSSVL